MGGWGAPPNIKKRTKTGHTQFRRNDPQILRKNQKSFDLQLDLFALAEKEENYSVIGEVKNREKKKLSLSEAQTFLKKFTAVKKTEKLTKAVGFVFSRNGFYQNAESYLKQHQIAYSDDNRWLE